MKGIVILGGAVIALGAAAFFLCRKKSNNTSSSGYCKLTPVEKIATENYPVLKNVPDQESLTNKFLNGAIERYQKKLLAYYVLNAAEEMGFSADQRLKLADKYGMVSLIPMLSAELTGIKEAGLRHTDIDKAAADWLLKNKGNKEGIDNIDSIEIILKKEIQQKAAETIKTQVI